MSSIYGHLIRSHGPVPPYEVVWNGTDTVSGRYLHAQEVARRDPQVQRDPRDILTRMSPETILEVLRRSPLPLSKTEISRQLGIDSRIGMERELMKLTLVGKIRRATVSVTGRCVRYEVIP